VGGQRTLRAIPLDFNEIALRRARIAAATLRRKY
jgi:hypothetical protein